MATPQDEDSLIAAWSTCWPAARALPLGPGHDCAVLPAPRAGWLPVAKVDAMVEGIHFRPHDSPRAIGHKALARVLSDFGAAGAEPSSVMISLGLSKAWTPARILALYQGMAPLAKKHRLALAGGETTRSPAFWINVTGFGARPAALKLSRATARPGDLLYVTGKLGGSFPVRHLRFQPRLTEGQWLARQTGVRAMMDLSDGLGKDLPRLASASKCSFLLEPARLPRHAGVTVEHAVNDGEDYELLFAVDPRRASALEKAWPFRGLKLTAIGHLLKPSAPAVTGDVTLRGFDHFS
jgi:thiamine-monophosphate kinase